MNHFKLLDVDNEFLKIIGDYVKNDDERKIVTSQF
jgi:hypothetical protein